MTGSKVDASGSFRAHANYLRAFSHLGDFNGVQFKRALTSVAKRASSFLPVRRSPWN